MTKFLSIFRFPYVIILLALIYAENTFAQQSQNTQLKITCAFYPPYVEDEKALLNKDVSSLAKFMCPLQLSQAKLKPIVNAEKPFVIGSTVSTLKFQNVDAKLVAIPSIQELLDTVDFKQRKTISLNDFKNLGQIASIQLGESKVWVLTVGGLKVLDLKENLWSFSQAISIEQVRPKDTYLNEKRDSLWLFGKDLYRYSIKSNQIYRYKPQNKIFNIIRKIYPVQDGLWLATDKGIFFVDDKNSQFYQLTTQDSVFTQIAEGDDGSIWFASNQSNLVRINMQDKNKLNVAVSEKLNANSLVDMLFFQGRLMLLLSKDHGKKYNMAYLNTKNSQLALTNLTLYSLKKSGDQLYGAEYEKLFAIEKDLKSATMLEADIADIGNATIGKQVLFTGASYVMSDSTSEVRRSVVDISKGWKQPIASLALEGWAMNQPIDMYLYLPLVIDMASSLNDVWFIVGNNSDQSSYDSQFLLQYNKKTHLASLYFSSWDAADQSEVFLVKSLSTPVPLEVEQH